MLTTIRFGVPLDNHSVNFILYNGEFSCLVIDGENCSRGVLKVQINKQSTEKGTLDITCDKEIFESENNCGPQLLSEAIYCEKKE